MNPEDMLLVYYELDTRNAEVGDRILGTLTIEDSRHHVIHSSAVFPSELGDELAHALTRALLAKRA